MQYLLDTNICIFFLRGKLHLDEIIREKGKAIKTFTMKNDKELSDKILAGLKKAYDKMVEFKRKNNGEIVVIRDNKIVRIKP